MVWFTWIELDTITFGMQRMHNLFLQLLLPIGIHCCQSIGTLKLTEVPVINSNSGGGILPTTVQNAESVHPFSVNLTEFLANRLQVDTQELVSVPVYFSDAEQSRPFVIRRQTDGHPWYQLTTTVLPDRENICDKRMYPERMTVSQACCPLEFTAPAELSLTPTNYPCCVYLGVTVLSKGTYFIRIDVGDVNDNAPFFTAVNSNTNRNFMSTYRKEIIGKVIISIPEGTPPNSWFALPMATDPDEGMNGAIRYSISTSGEERWAEYFRLLNNLKTASLPVNSTQVNVAWNNAGTTGHLSLGDYSGPGLMVLQTLDRESIADFNLRLVAADLGEPIGRSSTIQLQILVLDENDNAPVFEKTVYEVEVNENQAGIPLLYVKANDSDSDNNGRVVYFMKPSRTDNTVSFDFLRTHIQLVPMNDGVTLRLSQPLDYERSPAFHFDLVAADQGRVPLSSSASILITVRNMNDHPPLIRFFLHGEPLEHDYARLSVTEHFGTVPKQSLHDNLLCHVHVTDADSNLDKIQCNVESGDRKFVLREVMTDQLVQRRKIYELIATTLLDRESTPTQLITIRCQDDDGPSRLVSQKQLHLTLKDVNDNPPKFLQEQYHGYVSENAVNAIVVFHLSNATWKDGIDSNVICAVDNDTGINANIQYLLQRWLEEEKVTKHGTENGSQIEDEKNSVLRYDHSQDANQFYIDPTTGQLRTRTALDCEKQKLYRFVAVAMDKAQPPESRYTATVRVTIEVRDENDNPPVMDKRHHVFKVKENLPRHSRVGQIHTTDADVSPENRRTVYELRDIVNINASQMLFIESHTGVIRTRKVLDREEIQQIPFVVIARNEFPYTTQQTLRDSIQGHSNMNNSKFYDEASVTVEVEDENDNAPVMLPRGSDRQSSTTDGLSTVADITFNTNIKIQHSPCVEFPYYFADADDQSNGEVDVVMEPNPYFEFRLANTLICQISDSAPPAGQSNLRITVSDRPSDLSKVLRRRFTVRMHVIQEEPGGLSDKFEPSVHLKSDIQIPKHPFNNVPEHQRRIAEDQVSDKTLAWSPDIRQHGVMAQGRQASRDRRMEHKGSAVIIVTILVAVSILLCLLLLGAVIALRRASLGSHVTASGRYRKQRKSEDKSRYDGKDVVPFPNHHTLSLSRHCQNDGAQTGTMRDLNLDGVVHEATSEYRIARIHGPTAEQAFEKPTTGFECTQLL
ncbi:protocadherin-9 [Clonorchis sinensis]|uniref:Protocadherin-9 n=1 Tax=Clonorchis sinensis TaxID=79923 RepID=H2KTP1_CLOSI|nr:protocadherin-9 [Clonorchis sinensis]